MGGFGGAHMGGGGIHMGGARMGGAVHMGGGAMRFNGGGTRFAGRGWRGNEWRGVGAGVALGALGLGLAYPYYAYNDYYGEDGYYAYGDCYAPQRYWWGGAWHWRRVYVC
jgi:hypothetical protein